MRQTTYGVYWWYQDGAPAGAIRVDTRYDAITLTEELEESGFLAGWIVEAK